MLTSVKEKRHISPIIGYLKEITVQFQASLIKHLQNNNLVNLYQFNIKLLSTTHNMSTNLPLHTPLAAYCSFIQLSSSCSFLFYPSFSTFRIFKPPSLINKFKFRITNISYIPHFLCVAFQLLQLEVFSFPPKIKFDPHMFVVQNFGGKA